MARGRFRLFLLVQSPRCPKLFSHQLSPPPNLSVTAPKHLLPRIAELLPQSNQLGVLSSASNRAAHTIFLVRTCASCARSTQIEHLHTQRERHRKVDVSLLNVVPEAVGDENETDHQQE